MNKWLLGLIGGGLLAMAPAQAAVIDIVNPGLETPVIEGVDNVTFDGVHGPVPTGVPGWFSNEPSSGGAIRYDIRYPGRTGNNVLYLHGSGSQNFYTAGFDLGVDLQSNTTYILNVDAVSWWYDPGSSITQDYMTFRIGVYTGADYGSRVALTEYAGNFSMLDQGGVLLPSVTMTLMFTTATVDPGTKFWIGGDRFGWAGVIDVPADWHIPSFDNFQLTAVSVPEPSTVAFLILGAFGLVLVAQRKKKLRSALLR